MNKIIHKLRKDAKLTREKFGEIFGVTPQSVQKWENGTSTPELDKIIKISKYFDVSLDYLILGNSNRVVEEQNRKKELKPQYANMHDWEFYSAFLPTEYQQSIDEGLDIEKYKEVFNAVALLPKDEIKKKLGDVLFEVVINAKQKEGYKYVEPSDLEGIKALRTAWDNKNTVNKDTLESKIYGAWMGRVIGCLLGKPIENVKTDELVPFLKESNNYPMYRYIYNSDVTEDTIKKYKFAFEGKCYADVVDGMPVDDDTNYVVLAQEIVEKYGRDFTPFDVSRAWLDLQSKGAYCTAERVAFCNFVKGYEPPQSAVYKNPYREWIGAQIRGDYFGYINPGNPEMAAEMAWRDASISHIKNGIYGEMFVSAMIACAALTDNMEEIILGGLAQIPCTSRLYEDIMSVVEDYRNGVASEKVYSRIHKQYDEYTEHGWCHTNSNAMVVAASLLYGNGDFGKSICMSVETGFDTDCNGATVGSIVGMAKGIDAIGKEWTAPVNDTLHTSIFGVGTVKVSERAKKTMEHLAK